MVSAKVTTDPCRHSGGHGAFCFPPEHLHPSLLKQTQDIPPLRDPSWFQTQCTDTSVVCTLVN